MGLVVLVGWAIISYFILIEFCSWLCCTDTTSKWRWYTDTWWIIKNTHDTRFGHDSSM